MFVEIRHEGQTVRVRRFGAGPAGSWFVVRPGERDERFTRRSHEELMRLGDGVWEFPIASSSPA